MTASLRERGIQAVLLDIEGTTTPIAFVYEVLFPFARKALRSYLRDHLDAPDLREPLRQLHEDWTHDLEHGAPPPPWPDAPPDQRVDSVAAYVEWLMDRDRKASGLKALQGLIWADGYHDGILHGDVFQDVPAAFARWSAAGIRLAIFSSGSVLAQQMLFRTTTSGDLTRWITAYFDTSVGPKASADSYRRIATALRCPPEQILFVSDTATELTAARAAGCPVLMCRRPGNRDVPQADFETIDDFGEVR
ncbi:MAG TPA: acireductone synthase [Vicinamibacterales bacterium]|nr:acireductone synthase [Vicinamibacterales bacterium]